jgi:hypothetical protein
MCQCALSTVGKLYRLEERAKGERRENNPNQDERQQQGCPEQDIDFKTPLHSGALPHVARNSNRDDAFPTIAILATNILGYIELMRYTVYAGLLTNIKFYKYFFALARTRLSKIGLRMGVCAV